jgi:hypothetical protein
MQEIQECTVQEAVKSSKVDLQVSVELGCKAIVRALFYGSENQFDPIAIKIVVLEGDDYKNWGTDDAYLENIVFERLGITKA